KVVEAQPEPAEPAPQIVEEAVEEAVEDLEGAKPARSNRDLSAIASKPVVTSSKGESEEEPTKPKKGGWWQRRGFF
ncbi:hypothetical protein BMJ22_26805, partial [Sinorhizobium medicae]